MDRITNRVSLSIIAVVALCLLLAGGWWLFAGSSSSSLADEAAQRMPYDAQATVKKASLWAERLERDPEGGALEANHLAASYLALQRERGRVEYAHKAEAAARRSLAIRTAGNYEALRLLASSLLSQHRFEEALETAKQAAALTGAGNRLLAQVHLDLGNYDRAAEALGALTPDSVSLPRRDLNARMLTAQLLMARGYNEQAFDLLQAARKVADASPSMPHENVGWYRTMVCHHLVDHGKLEAGEQACQAALEVFPQDYRAMTGLAEVAAYREDHEGVIDWAGRALAASPENPEALRLLIDAHRAQDQPQRAAAYADRLEQLYRADPRLYGRHWSLYLADEGQRLDEALQIARKDLMRRHDSGAYDALAWVLYQQGRYDGAEAAMQKALAEGARDAGFFHHAGMIARAQDRPDEATAWFGKAQAVNPY